MTKSLARLFLVSVVSIFAFLLPQREAVATVGPCIFVTKVCSTNLVALCGTNSSSIGFSGIVSNCGFGPLTNVVLVDDLTGGVVLQLDNLAEGATAPWSTNLEVTADLCGSNVVNTITATGADAFAPAATTTNQASCSFTVECCAPAIKVYKQVVCITPTGCEPFDHNLNNQKSAFGVRWVFLSMIARAALRTICVER